MTTAMKLNTFKIGLYGPNESFTEQPYANGNQQVKVFIYINKEVFKDNQWQTTPLSESELKTLTIVEYSSLTTSTLPAGWSMEIKRNEFDMGQRGSTHQEAAAKPEQSSPWETHDLYLKTVSTDAYRFMARVVLDDHTIHTTHSQEYESMIKIAPQRPYTISALDLELNREDAYSTPVGQDKIDVDVFYWSLPSNLTIKSQSFENAGFNGKKVKYAYQLSDKWNCRVGGALVDDVTSLTLGEVGYSGTSPPDSTSIPLRNRDDCMRAVRLWDEGSPRPDSYDNYLSWVITDNLGCVHKFVLFAGDDDTMILKDC